MSSKIGVALIGSGIFVKEEHLPAVLATPSLEVKAIYSRSLKSAKETAEKLSDVALYSSDSGEGKDYADLLKREDVKAVIIALPIPNQPEYIKQALKAGKHVLAEKPIAKDVATAKELLKWYHDNVDTQKVTFGIAENFRFLDSFVYAAEQVKDLGKVLGFRTREQAFVQKGGKYYETSWRKVPSYQGGFLLDGGVHFIAGTRLLLSSQTKASSVVAFTHQLQEHLPPADTVDAVVKTASGVSGTISLSFGTTFSGSEYAVACEKGTVTVSKSKVTVSKEGSEDQVKKFPEQAAGVKQEIKGWAEALQKGKADPRQAPEEALRDLELLEGMLQSNGKLVELKL